MKIFKEVLFRIETGEIISEDSFEYDGPLALCYTSGSEVDSDNVDYLYNRGMLNISADQQGMAQEAFDYWKYGEGDYQIQEDPTITDYERTLQANAEKYGGVWQQHLDDMLRNKNYGIDPETGMLGKKVYVPKEGATSFRDVESAQNAANIGLIPGQTELQRKLIAEQTRMLDASAPIRTEYLRQTMEGIDPRASMNRAQADVEHGYGLAAKTMKNNAFRSGLDPSSGKFAEAQRLMVNDRTKGIVGARTGARIETEDRNYDRLKEASGLMSGIQ